MTPSRRLLARLTVALLTCTASAAWAQDGLSHLDDATTVPQGLLRFYAMTAWTRYDALFTAPGSANHTMPLGGLYSSDSLGVAQLPRLTNTQTAIQALTGTPYRLSLGSMQTTGDARVAVTPFRAEYGLTNRISLSATVPLVQTRTAIFIRANPKGTEGNVGVNPATVNPGALAQDSALVAQFQSAAAALETTLQGCETSPTSNTNCSGILARQSDVNSLLQSATFFSSALAAVYGSSAQLHGAAVVPVTGSAADLTIHTRITQFDSSFRAFLNTGPLITSVPAAAGGVVGQGDLQALLQNPAVTGLDSLNTSERISIGDIEFSAKVLLHDSFADSSDAARAATWHSRLAFTGTVRLGTGQTPMLTNPLDIGTGNGTTQLEGRLATLVQHGPHLALGVTAEYTYSLSKSLATTDATGTLTNFKPAAGSSYDLQLAPRWQISNLFGVFVTYGFHHVDPMSGTLPYADFLTASLPTAVAYHDGIYTAAGNTQTLGLGFNYTTVPAYERGGAMLPIDISFTHQEALSGAQQMPKFFRDQIEFRFYLRVRKAPSS